MVKRTLELREIYKYQHLPQKLEYMDPLLKEEDSLIIIHKGRPYNTSKNGIIVIPGTVTRRPRK